MLNASNSSFKLQILRGPERSFIRHSIRVYLFIKIGLGLIYGRKYSLLLPAVNRAIIIGKIKYIIPNFGENEWWIDCRTESIYFNVLRVLEL